MKRRARTFLVAGCLVAGSSLPALALAQVEEPEEVTEGEATEMDEAPAEAAGTGAVATTPAAEGQQPQVNETHTVQGGDTLWDLCGKYLNSPWYWPKIWSYNPHISNAHWIYPGNELRFYPSDESLPTNVEVSRDLSMQDGEPTEVLPEDLVKTSGVIKVGQIASGSYVGQHIAFIEAKTHEISGQIMNSVNEAQMLADYDQAYVKLKSAAKKGEPYAVYRTLKQIEHPITGDPYGYMVEIIGGVTVVDTSPTVATVMVRPTFRPIERGDFVGPWPESFGQRIEEVPNTANVKGYIIETLESVVSQIGEYHVVFIDRGRSHGVQVGNSATVYHRGDGFTKESEGLPNEPVGRLLIIDVQENSATALVTRSVLELSIGDKIEMTSG